MLSILSVNIKCCKRSGQNVENAQSMFIFRDIYMFVSVIYLRDKIFWVANYSYVDLGINTGLTGLIIWIHGQWNSMELFIQ